MEPSTSAADLLLLLYPQASKQLEDSLTTAHEDLAKDISERLETLRADFEDLLTKVSQTEQEQEAFYFSHWS